MKKFFVICLKNDEYQASLDMRKVYEAIEDEESKKLNMIRVIDESGEDYLYPQDFFAPVTLPESARSIFSPTVS